jgi:cell division protein FtsB
MTRASQTKQYKELKSQKQKLFDKIENLKKVQGKDYKPVEKLTEKEVKIL